MLKKAANLVGLGIEENSGNSSSANLEISTRNFPAPTSTANYATARDLEAADLKRVPHLTVSYLFTNSPAGNTDSEYVSDEDAQFDKEPSIQALLGSSDPSLAPLLRRIRSLNKRCRHYRKLYKDGKAKRIEQQQLIHTLGYNWLNERHQLQREVERIGSKL